MTKAKRWPNRADWARMDCITLARTGRKALAGEVERIQDVGLLRAVSRAVEAFHEIESKLNECKRSKDDDE